MKTALLLIDVQVGLMDYFPVHNKDVVLANINELLAKARKADLPVLYMQHDGLAGHTLEVGTAGWEIHPSISPRAGEQVIRKQSCSSFYQTSLEQELLDRSVEHVVIVGCMTEYCVDTACRHATMLGFVVTLASDAHTTIDNELLSAMHIIAHHNQALNGFSSGAHTVTVKPTSEIRFGA